MYLFSRYIYYLKKFLVLNIYRFGMWIMITMNILKSEIVIEEKIILGICNAQWGERSGGHWHLYIYILIMFSYLHSISRPHECLEPMETRSLVEIISHPGRSCHRVK